MESNKNIELKIPKHPECISVARLTSAGIGHNLGFNLDDIEDIKVCIGEACVNSLSDDKVENIDIKFETSKTELSIIVNGVVDHSDSTNELKFGILIIKSLMDKVDFCEYGLKMTKYIEDGSQWPKIMSMKNKK